MPTPADARHCPDTSAAALALLDPSGDAVTALDALPAGSLSDEGLVDALVATEKQLSALAAKQQEFLAEISRRDPRGEEFSRDEVACALHLAPAVAEDRLDVADQLCGRLDDTLELMRAGLLPYSHARILAHATETRTDEVAAAVQDKVFPRGCGQTPGEFRASARRAVARLDRKTEQERHQEEVAGRKVVHYPDADGMADIWLRLGADGAAIVMAAITAWAAKTDPNDERTADQRRADAIVEICQAALAMPGLQRRHGARPAVNITVAASTLAGLDEFPGEMDGYGPVPAGMARRWASDPTATLRYWAVDAQGRILDRRVPTPDTCPNARPASTTDTDSDNGQPDAGLASEHYVPPASLARHVITRDTHCVHPGCRRKAWACELDHRTAWPTGPTSAENLQPLCKRHHRLKHHGTWTVHKAPDGSYEWVSPTRHTYRYRPPEHPAPEPEPPPPPGRDPNDDPPPY